MLLVLDAGNSKILFGLYNGEDLVDTLRAPTSRDLSEAGIAALLSPLLARHRIEPGALEGVAISSVVPAISPVLRSFATNHLGAAPEFVGEDLPASFPLRYEPPAALGADRLANAAAALRSFGGPAVVVDLGTASTYDAISAKGEFIGGAIAPGLEVSLEALSRAAPHLPKVTLGEPPELIGGSTQACLHSGAYFGALGQVESLVRRFRRRLGGGARVIATGGLSPLIARGTRLFDRVEPNLTLEGVRILWTDHHSSR